MKKMWRAILLIYIIIFSFIFVGGLLSNKSQIMYADFLPLIISTIIFLIFWLFIYKVYITKIKEINKKKEIIIFTIISIIILGLECLYGYCLLSNGNWWDMYVILRAGKDIANGNQLHYDDYIYFQLSVTNRFATILLSYVYKLAYFFNITNEHIPHLTLNILSIFISFVCLYFIIRKLYGNKLAIFMYAFSIFLTPVLIAVPITYTDTLSMPYIMLAIVIYLRFKNCDNKWKSILLTILLGFTIFIGCQLKMTVMFVGIGILVDIIINQTLKKNLKYIILFIAYIIISVPIYNIFVEKNDFFQANLSSKQYYIPYELYILFGADEIQANESQIWYGTWNQQDILYILTGDENYQDEWNPAGSVKMYLYDEFQSSYEHKQTLARQKIIETLKGYGILGTIKHYYFKSVAVFADGTYYIPKKLALGPLNRNNIILEIFSAEGKYFEIYFYIAQGIHMCILLFSIISCYIDYKNKEKKNIPFVISLICLFLFLLIWESRSRYVLNYSLLFYILTCGSLSKFKNTNLRQLFNHKKI